MPVESSTISSGPLVYFLTHSGTFIVITGTLFFIMGLAFGWLTWSRYRRLARRLQGEIEGNKDEIALLKRKLAELVSRQPNDEEEEGDEADAISPIFRGTEDLVLGSFLATASQFIPDSQAPELFAPENVEASDLSPPAAETTPLADPLPAPEILDPLPSLDLDLNPTVSAPATPPPPLPTTPHIFKSLIGGSATAVDAPESQKDVSPKPQPEPALSPAPAPADATPAVPAPSSPAETAAAPANAVAKTDIIRLVSDPHLGLVYKTKPQVTDDLSQLKGVASGIQHRLNELGVYTFKQIALWSDENILEFSRLLSFKDRIHREQWVEQARELHFHAYKERI